MGAPGRVEGAREQALNRLLDVFAGELPIAYIGHDPEADMWSLAYADTWLQIPSAFPLSPLLPLTPPERGYDTRFACATFRSQSWMHALPIAMFRSRSGTARYACRSRACRTSCWFTSTRRWTVVDGCSWSTVHAWHRPISSNPTSASPGCRTLRSMNTSA
jgi:hypothetical protein